ncbi:MAG: peptidylprolyl isomerase [Phycisphaera sp.]|nr:MAG: peptidylprolyl isomerase [Phycisphaera sp.]
MRQIGLIVSILFAIGCSGGSNTPETGARPRGGTLSSRAALVDGTLVTRDDLWPLLAERVGAAALEAIALDRAVGREADRRGLRVTEADLRAEREIVERALIGTGLTDRQQRGRVVAEARARRGWGPEWFDGLLRRNALARKLTAASVQEPGEAEIVRLYEVMHGARREVRVIVMASERDVARLRAEVAAALAQSRATGEARFMILATEQSSDVSAARGGLLDPVGRFDATYPDAFREAVFETGVGMLTPVVALDEGFAVALVVGERSGGGLDFEMARAELVERLSLDAQQRAMAALFERLRAAMRVEPLDDSLEWSWEQRGR